MEEETKIEFKGDYIHIIHPKGFQISPESLNELYFKLAECCKKNNCYRVLSECDSPRRTLSIDRAFKSGNHLSSNIPFLKIACCFYNYVPDETSEFFKTVAFNRGVRVEFFSNRDDAIKWLKS